MPAPQRCRVAAAGLVAPQMFASPGMINRRGAIQRLDLVVCVYCRCPAAGIRSSALDQPATEAEAAPAEPDWNSYAERLPPLPAGLHKTSTAAPPVDGAATGFQTIAAAAAADATARKKVRPIVKVSKSGNTSAVAGYIISVLDDAADGTALVRAVGAAATEVALKALTRYSS